MSGTMLQLLVKARDTARSLFFLSTALLPPYHPRRGVTIVAPLRDGASLSKVMRDFAIALKESGIPYQTFDLCLSKNVSVADTCGALTPWWKFRARKFDHVVEMFTSPFPNLRGVIKAPVLFWEFESGFPEKHPEILPYRNVIAMSDFNAQYLRKALPATVHKMIYPFRAPVRDLPSRDAMRAKFGIAKDAFAVFFNFDISSGFGRKNPNGAMHAFAKAFSKDNHATLIFKTMHARQHPDVVSELNRLAKELGIADRFLMVTDYLPHNELYGLTAACDCYFSLHRGEGFGLGIAEAMSLGVPVVTTAYSANMEFCNAENALLVPFKIVPLPDSQRTGFQIGVTHWAEPDLDAAATALRCLYESPDLRHQLGEKAKRFIADHFSIDNFKKSVEAFLANKHL